MATESAKRVATGRSFHHHGTDPEKICKSDFFPFLDGTTRRCSFSERRDLEGTYVCNFLLDLCTKMNSVEENFRKVLHGKMKSLRQTTLGNCDVIIYFCYIASRAGTDINNALDKLHQVDRPVILVVLHHTFEPEKVIPDSNAVVNREQILAVDCLFYENTGLLQCQKNEDAVNTIANYLKSHKLTSYACFKDNSGNLHLSSDDSSSVSRSTASLIHSEDSQCQWCLEHWKSIVFCIGIFVSLLVLVLLLFFLLLSN